MTSLHHIATIPEMMPQMGINRLRNKHVELFDFSEISTLKHFADMKISFGFFVVVYKQVGCGTTRYGMNKFDYTSDTFIYYAPLQTIQTSDFAGVEPQGKMIIFSPELLRGTALDGIMRRYNFFGYAIAEALHTSDSERQQLLNALNDIEASLNSGDDDATLIAHIEQLLNKSEEFYKRQFDTRQILNHDIVSRFEQLIAEYFHTPTDSFRTLPTMQYFADRLFLSPNYLGDLIKNATGRTAKDLINHYVVDEAKRRLASSDESVANLSWQLGFEYPQYFSNMFKKQTGMTPQEYRKAVKGQANNQ